VYEKQAFPIRYKLYATTEFEINSYEAPQYDGFLSEKQADDGRRQLQLESYQGRNYRTVDILSEVLFAQRSGTLTIPPSKIGLRVPIAQADDDPFFGSSMMGDREVRSAPVTIQVRPLPIEGKPADFSGAVGSFRMRAELLSKTPKTNESLTIRLTLEGTGNLKQVTSPTISFPQDFEVYDPKETYEEKISATEVYGKKIIEYFAIPRHTGAVTIPALTFSYFDPHLGRYETLHSQAFSLQIAQGRETASDDRSSLRQQEQLLRQLYAEGTMGAPAGLQWAQSWSYLLLFPLLALLGLIAYLVIARERGLRADSLGYKASRANSVATKRLRTARKLLEAGARDAFYEETLRALWGYLGDKLRLPGSELSRASVSELLRSRGLDEETIARLTSVIDEVEFARYAPAKEGDMQALYDMTAEVISAIDTYKL
jgi:batD protein